MLKEFTFCVLAYNHEGYIVEHLESIKYQILNYGGDIDFSLILNDDCSLDTTVELIEDWVFKNKYLFRNVVNLFNGKNVGTCQSVINISKFITTRYCKITAGDDVYTKNNIFDLIEDNPDYSLLSGMPVRLINGEIGISFFEVFNYFASHYIYKDKSLLFRLSNLSVINAPNLFYSTNYLKKDNVLHFLKNFDVVEDWPLQVSIAKKDIKSNIISTKSPIVFYRRTLGSTYLVENERFVNDQMKMFDFLIDFYKNKGDFFQVMLLKNRKFLFSRKGSSFKVIFNLSYYVYFAKIFFHVPKIIKDYRSIKLDLLEYQRFYDALKKNVHDRL